MRFLSIVLVLCLLAPNLYAQQTDSRNYVIKRINKQSGANPDDVSKVTTQVQYFDGLGRPVQTVTVGQSPSGHDFIEPVEYDGAGRVIKQYLPYVSTGNGAFQGSASAAAGTWYTANTAGLKASDLARPYLETFFEPAPTSRVANQRAPGNGSANSTKKYKINAANQINRYDYDPASNTVVQNDNTPQGPLLTSILLTNRGMPPMNLPICLASWSAGKSLQPPETRCLRIMYMMTSASFVLFCNPTIRMLLRLPTMPLLMITMIMAE